MYMLWRHACYSVCAESSYRLQENFIYVFFACGKRLEKDIFKLVNGEWYINIDELFYETESYYYLSCHCNP